MGIRGMKIKLEQIPLTPALSQGERESVSLVLGEEKLVRPKFRSCFAGGLQGAAWLAGAPRDSGRRERRATRAFNGLLTTFLKAVKCGVNAPGVNTPLEFLPGGIGVELRRRLKSERLAILCGSNGTRPLVVSLPANRPSAAVTFTRSN